jgi:signal transduction histidine kinase
MAHPPGLRSVSAARPLVIDAVVALVAFALAVSVRADRPGLPGVTVALVVLLCVSCGALVLRRRYPVLVWLVALAISVVGAALAHGPSQALVPLLIALYSVAAWSGRRVALAAGLVTVGVTALSQALSATDPWAGAIYAQIAWCGMATAVGIAIQQRRAVIAAAEERAVRAEQAAEAQAQRRVTEERLRIARELHDVVAHHISVINVQAGVARHLLDRQPEQARAALSHIRESSEVVLREMSTLLGLMRTTDEEPSTEPAPGLAQVDALVDSLRRAGLDVTWRVSGQRVDLAPGADLAAYRLVQEALTNAHKHGSGTAELSIGYRPGALDVRTTNPVRARLAAEVERGGHGLVGMRERVAALGGRFEAGARDGVFEVRAQLPTGELPDAPAVADRTAPVAAT